MVIISSESMRSDAINEIQNTLDTREIQDFLYREFGKTQLKDCSDYELECLLALEEILETKRKSYGDKNAM